MANPTQDWVDTNQGRLVPPQPKLLFRQEQGPVLVEERTNYPVNFNPQFQQKTGTTELDAYPANPAIEYFNFTYRDPSQSIKPQNVGATNVVPRAELQQQLGAQLSPIMFPNYVTQSPPDWDDQLTVLPQEQPNSNLAAQRLRYQQMVDGFNPAVIQ